MAGPNNSAEKAVALPPLMQTLVDQYAPEPEFEIGAVNLRIGAVKGKVVTSFAQPIGQFAVDPDMAVEIAGLYLRYARELGSTAEVQS